MIFIYGLRLISDLAFYFFFANSILKSQILAAIPAIVYAIYLIVSKKLDTDWDRQSDFFSKAWKIFLIFGLCVCLIGKYHVFVQRSLPMAIVCLSTTVLLLRMLRHGPDIYLDPKYQLKNLLFLGCILCLALFLSSKFMLNAVLGSIAFMYNSFLLPILTFIITCFTFILGLFLKLLSWFNLTEIEFEKSHLTNTSTINPFADATNAALGQSTSAKMVLTVIGVIILIVCMFFLFRWLSSQQEVNSKLKTGILLSKEDLPEKQAERSGTLVNQVRRQYRKYLKLCKSYGAKVAKSDTSASIEAQSEKIFNSISENSEIREIYINARYNNHATKSDVRKLKQMYQTIKQKL